MLGGQVVAEVDGNGGTRGYVYAGGELVSVQQGGQLYWVHEDGVTKSKRITDVYGGVVSTVELDPWGADTNRSNNAAFLPQSFTSYIKDSNGGQDAMARRYSASSSFAQPDPYGGSYDFGDPQSLNRYAYTKNDPVNFRDPTGLLMNICLDANGHWGPCPNGGLDVIRISHSERGSRLGDYLFVLNSHFGGFFGGAPRGGVHEGEHGPQKPVPQPAPTPPGLKPHEDIEQPCIDRLNDFRRDVRSITKMLHGSLTRTTNEGKRFPGAEINPGGQSFSTAVNTLKKNGFSPNYSLDHPEGEGYQKRFNDGLWYHVIVNYPDDAEENGFYFDPHANSPTPGVTAHCHGTNPTGLAHIMDTVSP